MPSLSDNNVYPIKTGWIDDPKNRQNVFPVYIERGYGSGGGNGGGDDGVKVWRESVEKRLDSLDRRQSSIEQELSAIKVSVGKIETEIKHLPSKGFIVTALLMTLGIMVAIATFWSRIASLI